MKDALKIGLGIFLGLAAAGLCGLCAFTALSLGGVSFLASLIETPISPAYEPLPIFASSTPGPTSTFEPGHILQCHDLGLSFRSYHISETCPGGYGEPAEGAIFVVAEIEAVNFTADVLHLPSIVFNLDGYEPSLGSTGDCRYDENSFGNACWQWGGKLYPEVACEGWELFEVPRFFDPSGAILRASFQDYETKITCEAQWPLEPPP